MTPLTLKIDVTKIDKNRLFIGKTRPDGTTPKYLDLVVFPMNTPSQYGDTCIVKQQCSKEERLAKLEMPIIGNGKPIGKPAEAAKPATTVSDDEIPF